MTDHKFEPGQLVLARYNVGGGATWSLQHFSHLTSGECPFNSITGYSFAQCIPYTPETEHLLGTSQPYEPPKPPVDESKRFKAGEIVEIRGDNMWCPAVYLEYEKTTKLHKVYDLEEHDFYHQPPDTIRPLPDTASHADD